jgi:8-oxo-dGTP diphosphatase
VSGDDLFRPLVASDAVVFIGDGDDDTLLLLIQRKNEPFKGKWAFPGGLLDEGESCDECAVRELEEETRLTGVALEQLGVWSAPGRDPRGQVVTVAYVGRADASATGKTEAADDAADARWVRLGDVDDDDLAFDHADILQAAKTRLFG